MTTRSLLTDLWLSVAALVPGAASTIPTFNQDVLPILQKNCQVCHRPGEIGPMPLLTFDQTRPWAKAIKQAVLNKTMPPWFADPQYGRFANDRSLDTGDIAKIVSWVNAGAPEGSSKAPTPIHWTSGWNIQTDAIFQMPDPYLIPATGTLEYVYIVIPTHFTKDTWVTAAEVRPGARAAVHHAIAVVRPPGSQWMKEAKPFVPYIPPVDSAAGQAQPGPNDPQSEPVNLNYEYLAGYSPGMQAERFDADDSAKLVPAGSDIVLQVHYMTNGKTTVSDQTRIGLTLAKEPPRKPPW